MFDKIIGGVRTSIKERVAVKNSSLGVVIPVYRNEESIFELCRELLKLEAILDDRGVRMEVIFVLDGSPDKSEEKIRIERSTLKKKNWRILVLSRNFGQVNAILAGLYNSKNDFDVCVSADLQDPILMINEMYSQTLNGQQLVVAYRYKRSDSILTRFTSRVAYRLLSAEYENMPHTGFDFFLLSKKVKLELLKLKGRRRFLQGDLLSLGFDAKFLPYSRTKRQFGKSSYNFRSRFVLFLDFLFDSSYRPLRMISFSGGLISIMSVAIIAVALWNYFYEGNVIDGFTPIYIGIFFFGGLQLLALGIISEYVLRLSEIVSEKPVWILASEE